MPAAVREDELRWPAVEWKHPTVAQTSRRDFQWSNCWIAMIPPKINYPWAQASNHTQIDHWMLAEKFLIFRAIRPLKRDFGQLVVSLKVTIPYYWSGKKNPSKWYILPMFGDVLKIMLFEVKLSIKVVSFCMQSHLGLEIKIRDHPWTRFNATNSLTVSDFPKWATIGKLIFWGKLLCTILRAIVVYILLGLRFGNRAHPQTRINE